MDVEYILATKTQMFRSEVLLWEILIHKLAILVIIKGRMKGKAFWEERDYIMLNDLVSSVKYLEVQRAAEDWQGWRTLNRRGMI